MDKASKTGAVILSRVPELGAFEGARATFKRLEPLDHDSYGIDVILEPSGDSEILAHIPNVPEYRRLIGFLKNHSSWPFNGRVRRRDDGTWAVEVSPRKDST
jgi:hypothetical protein